MIKGMAEAAAMPVEFMPAWVGARGRPTMTATPGLRELAMRSTGPRDLAKTVAALRVQDEYAERCRGLIERMLVWVASQPDLLHPEVKIGEKVVAFLAFLLQQGRISRSSTITTYAAMMTRCWPSVMTSEVMREFLGGLQTVSPALPELDGVVLSREVPDSWELLGPCAQFRGGMGLYLLVGLLAGMRLRETARIMIRAGADGFRSSDGGTVGVAQEATPVAVRGGALLKNTVQGLRFVADRTAYIPSEWIRSLRAVTLPWNVQEKEATVALRDFGAMLRAHGVLDVRAYRRTMAVRVREAAVRAGIPETEAVAWARRALGHREGSRTVYRYLGTEMSRAGQGRLAVMQV